MAVVHVLGAHHDDPSCPADHLHVRPVQLRQHLRGHHLVGGAEPEGAVDDVEHQVGHGQDRVDLVGHEHHRRVVAAPAVVEQLHHRALVVQVQRHQRLVAQQHVRIGGQRLGDAQPLLLAAGQLPDPHLPVVARPDFGEQLVDPGPSPLPGRPDPPPVAVQTEPHQVPTPQGQVPVETGVLGDVADPPVAPVHRPADHPGRARSQWGEAQEHLQQAGLARPVRAEHRDELTALHRQVEP
jgi:hypothetical protein